MKRINYMQLRKNALDMGVSVYTLIKRELNYRKKTSKDFRPGDCSKCTKCVNPIFDKKTRMQCLDIGVIKDEEADIKPDHVCDRFVKLLAGF